MQLGTGLLYAGNQYRLVVGGREFFLDLLFYQLFYHMTLRCWVVLDPKTGASEREYADKMHCYLNAVDAQLHDEHDGPSLGLILCKSKDAVVAEYAPRRVASPMGVAEYRVTDRTDALPAELRGASRASRRCGRSSEPRRSGTIPPPTEASPTSSPRRRCGPAAGQRRARSRV